MNFAKSRALAGLTIQDAAKHLQRTTQTIERWDNGVGKPRTADMEKLNTLIRSSNLKMGNPNFSFIDLFAGIGGLRRAFDSNTGIGGECVFTSEWDKYSQKTYRANYGDENIAGDIREISERDIPPHDLLLAGFPCQPFSLAGVSKKNSLNMPHGFDCERQGNLFFDVARIIKFHKPKVILLENVRNLLSHDKGRTFSLIKQVLKEELNYDIFYCILDAKSWVPQHRERIFIVGFPKKLKIGNFSFSPVSERDPLSGPKLRSILHPENGTEIAEGHFTLGSEAVVNDKYVLSEHLWGYLQNYAEKHRLKGNGFGFGLNGPDDVARTLSARYHKDGSEILIKRKSGPPRRLTPRECSRLMGFDTPDGSLFKIEVSDTQAYRQFGNAVVAPVVQGIAELIRPHLMPTNDSLSFSEKKSPNFEEV